MKVTAIQTNLIWEDIQGNLASFEKKIQTIDKDTDLLILPEMFTTGFTPSANRVAEDENGLAISWLKQKAIQNNFAIIASIIFREGEKYKNRLFFMKPDGSYEYYDKRHLFGTIEKQSLTAGNSTVIIEYKNWRILALICYDLRFPVWSRNTKNYDLLVYIANWPDKRIDHWKTLLKARAIENQSYTIGVNRIGLDGNNYHYNGNSMVFSPKGELLNVPVENDEVIFSILLKKELQIAYRNFFDVRSDADYFEIID